MLITAKIDSASAWIFQTKPQLAMYKSKFRDPSSVESILGYDASGSPFNEKTLEDFLWLKLFPVACDLPYLTYLLDLYILEPNRIGEKEREYFEDAFAACLHTLISFSHPSDILAKTTMFYRQDCWRICALLYCNTGIRVCPSPKLLATMTSRLIESIQESDISSAWHPYSKVLLWALFMGYCGSWDPFEKGWFMKESKRVARVLDLTSAEEMERALVAFLYHKITHGEWLRKFWENIEL